MAAFHFPAPSKRGKGHSLPIEPLASAANRRRRVDWRLIMTTSVPFDAAIAEMNGTMDEMERILARQGKAAPAAAPAPKH